MENKNKTTLKQNKAKMSSATLNLSSLIPWNGGKAKPLQVMKDTFIPRLEFTATEELITQVT